MLNLKFEQVRAFLHVASTGGNRKAANALHLTQPAIAARIKNLEEVLCTDLFERNQNKRQLTKQGEILLRYADQLEHLVNRIEQDVAQGNDAGQYLRVGVAETIAQSLLPKLVARLQLAFPDLQIEIQVDVSPRLLDALCNRELDIAFANGRPKDALISSMALPPIDLCWYTNSKDPIEDAEATRRLFDKPVITYPKDTRPFRDMSKALKKNVVRHVPIFGSSSLPCALQLVAEGIGVAALPDFIAAPLLEAKVIQSFDPGWAPDPLLFRIHRADEHTDAIVDMAVDMAVKIANETTT